MRSFGHFYSHTSNSNCGQQLCQLLQEQALADRGGAQEEGADQAAGQGEEGDAEDDAVQGKKLKIIFKYYSSNLRQWLVQDSSFQLTSPSRPLRQTQRRRYRIKKNWWFLIQVEIQIWFLFKFQLAFSAASHTQVKHRALSHTHI